MGERGQIAFANQLKLDFPLVPDLGRNLAILYGAATSTQQPVPARMTVLIDKDGIVRYIDRQINVRTHGPDMLLKMRELGMIK
jgi:peroxiredoxin